MRFPQRKSGAFTLIELLVVISVIALLVSILVPSLSMARQLAWSTKCKTNIRSLQVGNILYQADHGGFYAPGAADFVGNRNRWFGSRAEATGPFVSQGGSLSPYLPGETVRQCPAFTKFLKGFEANCGGYGYNNSFVGMYVIPGEPVYRPAGPMYDRGGNKADAFVRPTDTVGFADTAFVQNNGTNEYSFVEPPRYSTYAMEPRPSIHFRHLGRTNVVWLDSHVSDEPMTYSNNVLDGFYKGRSADYNVGWFGPKGIDLFDCN